MRTKKEKQEKTQEKTQEKITFNNDIEWKEQILTELHTLNSTISKLKK